jgi:hypothetical protein
MHHEHFSCRDRDGALHKPKARWSIEEDQVLQSTIAEHGPANWKRIALGVSGRTGKQCRERWITKLSPAFSSEPWTDEEDGRLIQLQLLHGNQWAKFRAELPRRSTVSIKNRWVSLKRKRVPVGVCFPGQAGEPRISKVGEIRIAGHAEFEIEQTVVGFEDPFSCEDFAWYL